ncbi:MAG: ribosome maturation factor RimM [Lachnospiraceae bacterium]|nr:ribosome maturation factor RimM [Lachnospiraceae bacterium]
MEQRFQVGVLSSTHGIRGEVKVFPTTDDVNRFKKKMELILDTGKGDRLLTVETVKFFKQFVILKFQGIDSINDIEPYKGKSLYVTRENAVSLGEGEYFIADLIGLEVYEENGEFLGRLKEVLETGANDVYEILLPDGSSLLLPAIKECILEIDLSAGRMKVHVMEGLR